MECVLVSKDFLKSVVWFALQVIKKDSDWWFAKEIQNGLRLEIYGYSEDVDLEDDFRFDEDICNIEPQKIVVELKRLLPERRTVYYECVFKYTLNTNDVDYLKANDIVDELVNYLK